MKNLKFSVVVPAYNEERNIKNCINSILNQNYSNLELIVINDGSKDRTAEICRQYEKKRKIILIDKKKNEGQMKAIRDGCSVSSGQVIAMFGGDQVVEKDFLEKSAKWFSDDDIILVGGIENALNGNNLVVKGSEFLDKLLRPKKVVFNVFVSGGGMCIRKNVLEKIGGFDVNAVWAEDMDMNIRIKKYCEENNKNTVKDPKMKILAEYPNTIREVLRRHYLWGFGRSVVMRKYKMITKDIVFRILYFPVLASLFVLQFFFHLLIPIFFAAFLYPAFYVAAKEVIVKEKVKFSVFLFSTAIAYFRLISTFVGTIYGLINPPSRTT